MLIVLKQIYFLFSKLITFIVTKEVVNKTPVMPLLSSDTL